MKRFISLLLMAASATAAPVSLEQGFRNVPDNAKPWAYYWWLNGNVDERTIKRDLEAMKQVGFGGMLLFDARGYHDDTSHVPAPPSKMEFMSKEWRKLLKFTIETASKQGLEVSVNLSSCAGALKGPWEVGDDSPKKLVWTATEMRGTNFTFTLTKPEFKRFWDVGVVAVRHDDAPAKLPDKWQEAAPKLGSQPVVTEVVDLTSKVDKQAKLTTNVPKGRWTLLRFGYTTMDGHEFDVDILDPKAVEGHFNRMGKAILSDAGPLATNTLTHFYSVSWEGAIPTWTRGFDQEYVNRRAYPLRTWLPVLAGFTVKKTEDSERFLRDYYKTLSECFRDNFYGKMRALCADAGMKWHSESGGPWNRKLASFAEADQLSFLGRNDMPQGEFWFTPNSKRPHDMNRPPAMAAHIYGKPLAATEAFTHMVQHWSAYPSALKPFADAAFCDGVNHFIWHTFTASPASFGKPGIEYFAGTHINPNVTWFPQAKAFLDYLGRCQFMLRQGVPITDVCVYIGAKPYQHWGRGTSWSERATLRLPAGFNYDLLSTDVLVDRLYLSDGNFTLPDGINYRMFIVDLDDDTIPLPALRKIAGLRSPAYPMVLGQRKPERSYGFGDGKPALDNEVRTTADRLWANPSSIQEAMTIKTILPDCEGPFEFVHRRDDKTDIYFLSGKGTAECIFRVKDRRPEFWDPVTGKINQTASWRYTPDDRTAVIVTLPENGSVFVVFRTFDQPRQLAPTRPPTELAISGSWNVRFDSKSVVFDTLVPWDTHADPAIKYFSGAATYRKTFELTAAQAEKTLRLRFGDVKHIAQVKLNGKDLGVVWTAPWSVELTGVVKPGRNDLEVIVVNTWVNRLIGDAAIPPSKRTTRTNVKLEYGKRTLKAYQGFASEDPLMPSGLLGPVRLEFAP